MGVKCSLLGHSFGDAEVERDREERGDEVVTIVREVEHCTRCDETRVVSENKEVTSVVEPEEVGVDETGEAATAGTEPGAGTGGAAGTKDDLDEYEPPDDPAEEDAEILDEDAPDRDPGEWPDEEDDGAEGFEPETLTTEEPEATGAPDGPDEAESDAPDEAVPDAEADEERRPGGITVPAGEYVCPECGFRTGAVGSSLRAGDACPECQRGYLREDGERNS